MELCTQTINMTRFLTPSKIGLVALIHVYCDSVVPASSVIDVLSFILADLSPVSGDRAVNRGVEGTRLPLLSASDFAGEALAQPSCIPGRTIYDLFVKKLWEIDSLDALHVLIQTSDDLFLPPAERQDEEDEAGNVSTQDPDNNKIVLSRTSPLGLYIRRVQLEFTRLQFSDVIKLWLAFVQFKQPTLPSLERVARGSFSENQDRALQELDLGSQNELLKSAFDRAGEENGVDTLISVSDVERILEFQTDRLQRQYMQLLWESHAKTRQAWGREYLPI